RFVRKKVPRYRLKTQGRAANFPRERQRRLESGNVIGRYSDSRLTVGRRRRLRGERPSSLHPSQQFEEVTGLVDMDLLRLLRHRLSLHIGATRIQAPDIFLVVPLRNGPPPSAPKILRLSVEEQVPVVSVTIGLVFERGFELHA